MDRIRRFSTRPVVVIALIAIIAVVIVIRKIQYLSEGPVGEKDCPPLSPGGSAPVVPTAAYDPTLQWEQRGGTINDASCLDKTAVYGIVEVRTVEDISRALQFARAHHIKVSIAGVRHSMGGQAFAQNALVLDMRTFNSIVVNESSKTVVVESGATWHDIQNVIHPRFSIKAMQSTDIFSVGGSISVNAHGMDHQAGSVGDTIKSLRVMLADGSIVTASKNENADLFRHIVGGYGLFGIVLDAQIEVTDNVIYNSGRQIIPTSDFPTAWAAIEKNKDVGLFYAHLSTAPSSFLKETILYTYTKTDVDPLTSPPLGDVSSIWLRRLTINLSKYGGALMELKWFSEKNIEPKIETCETSRNAAQASGEACLVSRNEPMHDSVPYLKNNLKNDTDILHEYFIPRDQLLSFVDGMRNIFIKDKVNLLNASVRVVHKEDIALNYAPKDMFSVVLYINQTTDTAGNERMKKATQDLINLTIAHQGRFFLPYQLYYSPEQLAASYPMIKDFFIAKKQYDPEEILTNTWYNMYAPKILNS